MRGSRKPPTGGDKWRSDDLPKKAFNTAFETSVEIPKMYYVIEEVCDDFNIEPFAI